MTADPAPATSSAAQAGERPSGPVAAALLAAGVGSLVLGIIVVWAEASESFAKSLAYDDDVGPLAGKTIWGVVAYLVSWLVLGLVLRRRDVSLKTAGLVTAVLLALAFVATFSPFFELFAPDE
jgi:hypothetical protein